MNSRNLQPIQKLIIAITDTEMILNDSQNSMDLTSILIHNSTLNADSFIYPQIKNGVLTIQQNQKNPEHHQTIVIALAKPQMFCIKNIYKGCQNCQVSSIIIKLNQSRKISFNHQETHKPTFKNLLPKGKYQENTINQENLHSGIHFNTPRKFRVEGYKESNGHLLLHQNVQK